MRVSLCYSAPAVLNPHGLSMTLITNEEQALCGLLPDLMKAGQRGAEGLENSRCAGIQRFMEPLTRGGSWTASVQNHRNLPAIER